MMKVISTENAPAAIGPYSQAIVANGMLYTSGQIAIDPKVGDVVAKDIEGQTEQVMKNLCQVLRAAGSAPELVVKTTCFLANIGDFAAFNEIYGKYLTEKPARSCVAAAALPKGALVEVEAVALLA
jgi:2-iminobutanoate/2-iminopropanoate deaminase